MMLNENSGLVRNLSQGLNGSYPRYFPNGKIAANPGIEEIPDYHIVHAYGTWTSALSTADICSQGIYSLGRINSSRQNSCLW
jgi:hypothetical protein